MKTALTITFLLSLLVVVVAPWYWARRRGMSVQTKLAYMYLLVLAGGTLGITGYILLTPFP
jgi:hypothetical protein